MFALMTNREIYRSYLEQLQSIYSPNEAAIITDWIFESMAGLQRSDIIKNPEQAFDPAIEIQLSQSLADLLQHKPVQYVLGEAWFFKMKLKVNDQVLIPRPETEELVQLVIDEVHKDEFAGGISDNISVLDIGTGSGCIAIAIKKNMPTVNMQAIDVSGGALLLAKENARIQQTDIQFLEVNFLDESNWTKLSVFEVIVSNPPYIPLNEKEKLDLNVTAFEPHEALFVPDNKPLLFYEKIAAFGKNHLADNGKIFVEIHEDLATITAELFKSRSYNVEIKKDIFGKERMIIATRHVSIA